MRERNLMIATLEKLTATVLLFSLPLVIASLFQIVTEGLKFSQQTYNGNLLPLVLILYSLPLIGFCLLLFFCNQYFSKYLKKNNQFSLSAFLIRTIKKFKWTAVYCLVFILISSLFGSLYYSQEKMIFFPLNRYQENTVLADSTELIELQIFNQSQTYSGWSYQSSNEKKPSILYFGGNAEESYGVFLNFYNEEALSYYHDFHFFMFDYPGYGKSQGSPSESAIYEMAFSAYDYVSSLEQVDENNIMVVGFSLGTGVATKVAATKNPKGLVLLAPYTSILDVVNHSFGIFRGPLEEIINHKFLSIQNVSQIECETLIVFSNDDEVIPATLSKQMILQFGEKAIVLERDLLLHVELFDKLTHNTIVSFLSSLTNHDVGS